MMREPVATTKTRQIRVVSKILTKVELLPLSLNCADTWRQLILSHPRVGGVMLYYFRVRF